MNSLRISFIIISFIFFFKGVSGSERKIFVEFSFTVFPLIKAYIFEDYDSDSVNLMNYEYESECLQNKTIAKSVNEFATKYEKVKTLTRNEVKRVRRKGFRKVSDKVCKNRRGLARSIALVIPIIAQACVKDETTKKKFSLNTLLLVNTALDYICSQNQSHFGDIYERHGEECLTESQPLLTDCQRKSFDLYFWERVPDKMPTIAKLLNGAVCE
jgi:hypothetical protein